MSIEGYIQQISDAHVEATREAIRQFGVRVAAEIKAAEARFAKFHREVTLSVERQQIVEEDLPPIIERHLGDVKAWLREAGHDV